MFNARAARDLAPGNHLTMDGAPGLRLVATAKHRTWTYRYKSPVDKRMRQVRLGRWPAMGPAAALAAWERLKNERSSGVDLSVQRRADRAAAARSVVLTVRRVCDDFLAGYRGTVADATWAGVDRLFRVEIGRIEALPAASITRGDAFDLLSPMRLRRPVVAHRLRQALGAAWDYALDAGRLPDDTPNWWRLVLRGKLISRGRTVGGVPLNTAKRVLSEAEVATLVAWLPNFSTDVADALTLYLWTGCRGAEIVQMQADEITREADGTWWTVPRRKLKMARNPHTTDLRVPLVGRALEVVERRLVETAGKRWMFPTVAARGHILQNSLTVAVWMHRPECETRPEQVRPRLPVTGWAPHDLRRTVRTTLAAMGCPAEIAEAILGHRMPGVQGTYDRHGYDPERRVWLTRLADRWQNAPAR